MDVITMESAAFKTLVKKIDQIAAHINKNEESKPPEDRLLTGDEVRAMLQISISTLYRMRRDGEIAHSIIKGKCMYRLSEVFRFAEQYNVLVDASTLEEMKHNYNIQTKGVGYDGKR